MNSSTRLDSAVFQLTPTRTRFDLIITVNGKKEKLASGLLDPFLSHLKTAQDQMAKGGYSIVLEPEGGNDPTWFTKGTVERFVRFVNTPEILERVYTIESEISQIEETIAIQGNNSIGVSTVEENQVKHADNTEGKQSQQDTNEEKAIVLYKPDAQPPEANGSAPSEGNSKVQLLKVLETRKSVLQKEQGMAFARAVAAGFDIDYIPTLMSFAECFGASRLMDASAKFRDLWKRKHESGQWLEIEAAEMMSNRSDFAALNGSGILLPNMAFASQTELDLENNGKTSSDVPPVDRQPSVGNQDNIQGQFPHHMFPPWPVHSPSGAVYQPYPVQGIPYYQPYPGNSPYMQPNYPPVEDPRLFASQNMGHRRHSMDSRHSNTESETWDGEAIKSRMHDEVDTEREGSQTGDRRKKASRSGRQKSGMVVIRNINYITKTENSSCSGSDSGSASDTDEDRDNQESAKTSERRASRKESLKKLNSSDREETGHVKDADGGHWEAFQNCLLGDVHEDRHAIDQDQFDMEKVDGMRRKKHITVNDPLVFNEQGMHEAQGSRTLDMHSISKGLTHMPKASNDELLLSARAGQSGDNWSVDDEQSLEVNGRSGGYRRAVSDDFIISKQESQSGNSYPSADMETTSNGLGYSNNNLQRKLFHDMNDDSYILEHRSTQVNDAGNVERHVIDIDSEFPMVHHKEEKSPNRVNYQPDVLSMMPGREAEGGSMSYDPALDYEMQAQASGASQDKNKEVLANTKSGSKRLEKEQKPKLPNSSDKRKNVGPIRRGKTSKLSPLDEARARAEKLRNYKADLQKMKKEKEEEAIKRIEALKMERQKRIAAKSSSVTTQSPVASNLTKRQVPTKLSPSSHKGSKFSDSEPGASSPLQRSSVRTTSIGSVDSMKASKTSKLNTRGHLNDNKLSRSVSSLPESKLEKGDSTSNAKASMARIRRLSEPKVSAIRQTSSVKPQGNATISKTNAADGPQSKKISAIVNHDKSKIAALPELKVRTSNASEIVQNASSAEGKTQKLNDKKSSMNSEGTMPKKNEMGILPNDDGDDNPVIEKTVVMLEREKPYAPAIPPAIYGSEEKMEMPKKEYVNDIAAEKTETSSTYVAIRAPVSPLSMDIIVKETSESQSHLQPLSTEIKMDNTEKKPSKSSGIYIAEETYQAPYARVSSLEDPSTRNSEYGRAVPTSSETAVISAETVKARVSDIRNSSSLDKIPEAVEKPQVKESPKRFRRLLKFGKKSHSSASTGRNTESDNVSIDGSEADDNGINGSSNEVHTLKNLISQDETPTANATQQKSSRSFSLLSPFRNKNSEKKIMMA